MKCAKCGAEIRPGCVYCSNCGQEAQIVTEINILEDDLLRSMLEEEDAYSRKNNDQSVNTEKEAQETAQKSHSSRTSSGSLEKRKGGCWKRSGRKPERHW